MFKLKSGSACVRACVQVHFVLKTSIFCKQVVIFVDGDIHLKTSVLIYSSFGYFGVDLNIYSLMVHLLLLLFYINKNVFVKLFLRVKW